MAKNGDVFRSATETYIVISQLGGGGAGEVFRVTDAAGTSYAAKVLRAGTNKQKLKRFQNELMFGLREVHPNLIRVLDFGRSGEDEAFYIMPLAQGTLRIIMKHGLEEDRRLPMFAEILDGVEAAHFKGIIHRDLKPENILYFSDPSRTCIADFGIAHFEEDQLHTPVETLPAERLANFEYAAPEQRRQGATVDLRADIYALGLILAELFTGEVPHGVGCARIVDRSPQFGYLDELVEKMRQQDPAKRPSSIREVKQDLVAHKNTFVEAQKLDRLRNVVIKDSDVTDPLVSDPPRIVEVKYDGSGLQIELSSRVDSGWISTFQNMPLGGLLGFGPEYHTFQGSLAFIRVPDNLAQNVLEQFKFYLEQTNLTYARNVREAEQKRVRSERNQLAAKLQQEEAIARVQSGLKW